MNDVVRAAPHFNEFRRCLVDLDVVAIRRLWQHVSPHLPQPASDEEALYALHVARTKTHTLPMALRDYSKQWLDERDRRRIANAVGIVVGAPLHRRHQALAVRDAMEDAVTGAIKAGIDIDTDAVEVKRRMRVARDKEDSHYTR